MLNIRVADYQKELDEALARAKSADIAVAFATSVGLRFRKIESNLASLLRAGGAVRIIVDLRLGNTHPDFLDRVLRWQARGLPVESRHYEVENGVFHPKLYIFHLDDDTVRVITGSANWTGAAHSTNVEHGVVLDGDLKRPMIAAARRFFDDLWASNNARVIDQSALDAYRNYWRRRQGLERKARRRVNSAWGRLQQRLTAAPPQPGFRWPSRDAAFFLGAFTARGTLDRRGRSISIAFRYGGRAYMHKGRQGYIGKGNVSFEAENVVTLVPQTVASRIAPVVHPATPTVQRPSRATYFVTVDLHENAQLFDDLRPFFREAINYTTFQIPRQIVGADRELQEEFMRGYGLACGLVSAGTYDPSHKDQVWLRPATENRLQFDQLVDLLVNRIGIPVYKHQRTYKDVAVKVLCENWIEIGFEVDWMDALVEEGARLNRELAPPTVS